MDTQLRELLAILHHARCATIKGLSIATGIRTATISARLKQLNDDGWVTCLGYAQVDPASGLAGSWWIPTRKRTAGIVWKSTVQAVVRVLDEEQAGKTRAIEFADHRWLARHQIEVSIAMCEIWRMMREGLQCRMESETYLRQVRKWLGNPKTPEQHASTHLVSVPDIRLYGDGWSLNIEIESSLKGRQTYERYANLAEENVYVLWVVRTKGAGQRLRALLNSVGMGRTSGNMICVCDLLKQSIQACITRASDTRPVLS